MLKVRRNYWGDGPFVDELVYVDLGDDPSAPIAAFASKQVHGLNVASIDQIDALKTLPHVQMYDVTTSETAVVRGKVTEKPFDDARVRKAMCFWL